MSNPVKIPVHRRTEITNEVLMMIINYHMVCFTNFVIDANTKFIMGDSFFYCIIGIVFLNVIYLVVSEVKDRKYRKIPKKTKQ